MTATRSPQPFQELRTLLTRLRTVVQSADCAPQFDEESQSLFDQLEAWVQSAEQRKRRSDSVIDAALDAVVAIDTEGAIVEWNREAERMFGWSADEVRGRLVSELIIPLQYRAAHEKGLQRYFKTGSGPMFNRRTELTAIRRDGSAFPIELTVLEPLRMGSHVVVHAFLRDISDRRRAESAIRGSEALYHSLVDSLPIHVIRKSAAGQLTFANRCYCDLLGRSLSELIGKTDFDLFPRELAEKYVQDDQRVAATGEIFHDIEKNVTEGKARYFEVYKVPVMGGDGKVAETQAIFWDVTDRVETRQELARERDLLRTLMDHLPDLVYVKDRESRYILGNVAQARLAGLKNVDELVGRTAEDFFPSDLANHYANEDSVVMESGEAMLDREEHWTDQYGREFWFLSSKVPLRDQDGELLGIVGIDRNITKRKRMEAELLRSNRELDEFVSVVTHDLQSPLRGVSTYCKLLAKEAESSLGNDGREYLQEALDGISRMQRLINSLRDYARATEKKREPVPIDLEVVLDQALSNLEVELRERNAVVTHDPLPTLPGDAVQLMQLLQNLIANAIKYCRGRQPQVHVSCEQLREAWHFSISDNGIGIEPQRLQDIFRIFQRLHADESEFSGTGIGLSVCKRIVERHNGRIWVESTPDVGSTFHFTLAEHPKQMDAGPLLAPKVLPGSE
ncbi:MAG: PAS domain S-box protein [Planctomycetaceae bacterium]